MSVYLPFDVLNTIIEMLANGEPPDFATMLSVSQTCHYLLPVCRKHLFSGVWLKTRINGSDVANEDYGSSGKLKSTLYIGAMNLAKLVMSSPEIAGYVRELVFYPHPSNGVDETLLPLLQQFDRLEKLHIRHHPREETWRRFEKWDSLAPSLQTAMVNLVHQQQYTLKQLWFTGYLEIPVSIVYPLTCLHAFSLLNSDMAFEVITDPPIICHPHPLRLKSLVFTLGYGSIESLLEGIRPSIGLPFFDLSELELLSAQLFSTGPVHDGVPISHLLPEMHKLKTLALYVRRPEEEDSNTPNFPDIFNSIHPEASANLETLRFEVWYAYDASFDCELPAAILQHTRTFPSLKHLGITINIILPMIDPSQVVGDLVDLDNLLSTEKFSSLESFFLCLYFFNYDEDDGSDDFEILLDIYPLMPQSSMNPALKFDFSTPIF